MARPIHPQSPYPILLPLAYTDEEMKAIRDWIAWNRHMVRATRPPRLDDSWYVGDGTPRDQSGKPFEPLNWKKD
ncbi:hypothetical protein [Bifidobacterium callitrichos]|uniref:Uncharacterized protein n=1 Tax=Bifidobacterium callitrichos DSM 23973 TaxID=1437609 RepID=A0A086ZY53_9BIFI|nr:hypothetical protein [Bifidobacterium callitrichos]KFI51453.1 hypothetical protein BCAL_1186 [Bifidobacterium callitrichos DSM 23973]